MDMEDEKPVFRIEFHPERKYPRIDDDGMYQSGPAPSITGTLLVFFAVLFLFWLAGTFL
jgi:hypothetical protein